MKAFLKSRRSAAWTLVCLCLVCAISCEREKPSVAVAYQYGIAYAPVEIMMHFRLPEKANPGVSFSWTQLGNTAAIREAMVAGKIQIGFMAIPPFLIGRDRGMNWKIFSGVCESPVALVSARPGIRSLSDIGPGDRIALPQPGSVQHILLAMACERELGDPRLLDDRLVTLSHPDGLNALSSGGVSLHFTSMPYLALETLTPGYRTVLTGTEAFGGDFSFIVAAADGGFMEKEGELLSSFAACLREAIAFINKNPGEAARILSAAYGTDPDTMTGYLSFEGTRYTSEVLGVESFADFMTSVGYLSGNLDVSAGAVYETR